MHERCSPQSRYQRWHGHVQEFPRRYLESLRHSGDHVAVVAIRDGDLIGLASAGPAGPGRWELGVLVEDDWQRRGVGRQLLLALVTALAATGADTLYVEVLASQRGMLEPLRNLGPVTVTGTSEGVVSAEVTLRA
jgi:GNAT superfamily N-acetyltransferase